jgi:hypothetical protein
MNLNTITATRGIRLSTPRAAASSCALVSTSVKPFGYQFDATRVWAGVRLVDGHTAMGPSAWSPPI